MGVGAYGSICMCMIREAKQGPAKKGGRWIHAEPGVGWGGVQLVAAVPRHGIDWRLARQPVRRIPAGGDVAAGLSGPAAALAAGHSALARHAVGRPNFAYELCLKRIDDAALATLDLSSWRLAFNGAEAVSPDTVRRFAQRFAACGLRPEAVAPVYGLAEATVGLLFPPLGAGRADRRLQREPFTREGRAFPATPDDATALRMRLRQTVAGPRDPDRRRRRPRGRRADRRPARVPGPSATRGYFRDPGKTALLFHDGWLDSGDAPTEPNYMYVTGRVKDIVKPTGHDLYPEEIEEAVSRWTACAKAAWPCSVVLTRPPARGLACWRRFRDLARGSTGPAARCGHARHNRKKRVGEPPDDTCWRRRTRCSRLPAGKCGARPVRALYEAGDVGAAPVSATGGRCRGWRASARCAAPAASRRRGGPTVVQRSIDGPVLVGGAATRPRCRPS